MNQTPPSSSAPPAKKKSRGCLTCLIILGSGLILFACLILLVPPILRALGIFGRDAGYVYQQSPDVVASQSLSELIEERNIEGVSVYVIPIKDSDQKGAFIILDSSKGYTGLSPLEDDNEVFLELLRDLTKRNHNENLRIAHLTVEYRDEEGNPYISFTVDQDAVEQYADDSITRDEFIGQVHLNLMDTLQSLGLDGLLEGGQP